VKLNELTGNISQSLESVAQAAVNFLPQFLGALLLLLVGLLLAYLLSITARSLVEKGLARIGRNKTIRARVQQSQFYLSLPRMGGQLVFWLVLLFFLAAAVEALGLTAVSNIVGYATAYVPRVLAAIAIVFVGFWFAEMARSFSARAAATANIQQGEALSQIIRVLILVLAAILAVEHLGINSSLLITLVVTVVAATLGAAALAFGLGARDTVNNIIGSHYARKNYHSGDHIRIGDVEGTVVEIDNTVVTVQTEEGRLRIPGQRFNNDDSILLGREG